MNSTTLTIRIMKMLLVVLFAVCVISIAYHFLYQAYDTETAVYGSAVETVVFDGVFIRDEEAAAYTGNGAVSYQVQDGAKLGIGSVIAEVYADAAQITLRNQIASLENELSILEKIQNPGTSESAQPANISSLSQERYKSLVYARECGEYETVHSDEEELLILLSTYQMITGTVTDYSAQILSVQSELNALYARQQAPIDTITADQSSYFISYTDGFENVLSPENMDQLTPEDLKAVNNDNIRRADGVIGKLVFDYNWYIAGTINNANGYFQIDDSVLLQMESTSEPVPAVIDRFLPTEDYTQTVVILRCNRMTPDLVQNRVERIEMAKKSDVVSSLEGIVVPREALRFKDVEITYTDEATQESYTVMENRMGVYVLIGESPTFRMVEVVYEGDDYILSKLNMGNDYVVPYDDIIVNGVNYDGS